MDWLRTLLNRCIGFFDRKSLDQDLDEEFRSHLDFATEENRRRGMPEHEARSAALRQFGGVTQIRERYRLRRGLPLLDTIAQDIRFATRQIWRAPGFAAVAIVTLALGIGANTAVFTLTHALLLSTLPVRDPGELVRLAIDLSATEANGHNAPLNLPIIEAIQKQSRSFHDIFAWCVYDFPFRDGTVNGGIHGAIVSGNAFRVAGHAPRRRTPSDAGRRPTRRRPRWTGRGHQLSHLGGAVSCRSFRHRAAHYRNRPRRDHRRRSSARF